MVCKVRAAFVFYLFSDRFRFGDFGLLKEYKNPRFRTVRGVSFIFMWLFSWKIPKIEERINRVKSTVGAQLPRFRSTRTHAFLFVNLRVNTRILGRAFSISLTYLRGTRLLFDFTRFLVPFSPPGVRQSKTNLSHSRRLTVRAENQGTAFLLRRFSVCVRRTLITHVLLTLFEVASSTLHDYEVSRFSRETANEDVQTVHRALPREWVLHRYSLLYRFIRLAIATIRICDGRGIGTE